MRKVIFGGANSLDNYFARKDGGMDWLIWSDEVTELMNEFWPRIDCIVMGRKTYGVAMAGHDGEEPSTTPSPAPTTSSPEAAATTPRAGGELNPATPPDQGGEPEPANPYGDIKTYVFSRTLPPGPAKGGAEIVSEDAGEFVRRLKAQDGKDICVMGGGDLARTLFEAGVIDEIGFNIHPVLLGSGVPLFYEMTRQIDLELIECRPLKTGCIYVSYRVKN